jgi:hypothetical protein
MAAMSEMDLRTHANSIPNILGKVVSAHKNQCFVDSDNTYLRFLERHHANRLVDTDWVQELEKDMYAMITDGDVCEIEVAVILSDIQSYLADQDRGEDFKAVIVDGQHRVEAFKNIMKKHPNLRFPIWFKVYLVNTDDDIDKLIEKINNRRSFNQMDYAKKKVNATFIKAITQLVGEKNMNRRYILKVKRCKLLNDLKFVEKYKMATENDFIGVLNALSEQYKAACLNAVTLDQKYSKSAVFQLIIASKQYQFMAEPEEWITKMM